MTQKELTKAIVEDVNKAEKYQGAKVKEEVVDDVLKSFVKVTEDAVKKNEKVQLAGFGSFESTLRAARTGRNPRTGEDIKIEACNVVKFKAAKAFKEYIN